MRRIIVALVWLMVVGCASTGMGVQGIPGTGDSTKIGKVNVKVVDLNASNPQALRPVQKKLAPELLDGRPQNYRVGAFDVLIVTVWEHPELTQPLGQFRNDLAAGQLIDADGTMYFPYVGRLKLAGLTLSEIQALITKSLSKVLKDPQVDIKVSAYRSQRVFVSGQVRNPGLVVIDDVPMNIIELINRAGGTLISSDLSGVQLRRRGALFELNLDELLQSGAGIDSVWIQPGDQVRIPSVEERVAYVLGEVERPSLLKLSNGKMSLIRALAEVGGYNALTANAAGVYVVRAQDSLNVTVYQLDGRSPVALAFAGEFQLQAKDLVYVDQTGLSRWNRIFQLLVPISSTLTNASGILSNTTGSASNIQNVKETW